MDNKIKKWENGNFPTKYVNKILIAKSVLINNIQIYENKTF